MSCLNKIHDKHRNTKLWLDVKKALDMLKKNQDIILQTKEEYVIRYLCEIITSQ